MRKVAGQSACARLDRLVEKERRCERDAGAAGGEAGEKADGRAGEGWGGLQAWGGARRLGSARAFIAPEE